MVVSHSEKIQGQSLSMVFWGSDMPAGDVVAACSTRLLGNMSFSSGDTSKSLGNRKKFLQGIGVDSRALVCAQQVHGGGVTVVNRDDRGRGAADHEAALSSTDALVTREKFVPLGILTADCLPVFFYDPLTPAIGLVHAGWRGSQQRVAARALEVMQERFGTHPEDMYVGFGPAIRVCCCEIGDECTQTFADRFITTRGARHYLDLVNVNKEQVFDRGVRPARVFDSGICTCCRYETYFSYRREPETCGRMMAVMMLS